MKPSTFNKMDEKTQLDYVARQISAFRASEFYPIFLAWLHELYLAAEDTYLQPDITPSLRFMMIGQVRCLKAIYKRLAEPVNPGIAASLDSASDFSEADANSDFPVEEYEPDYEPRG